MLKKLFVALALACAISPAAFSQSTNVIGTFKAGDGVTVVTSGQVVATLQPGIDVVASGFARFSPTEVDCGINGASVATNQAVRSSNSVTISGLTGHTFIVGDSVQVASMTDTTFNGTFTITGTTATSITYSQTAANATSGGGTLSALRSLATNGVCTVATNTLMNPSNTSWKFCVQPSFISPGSCFIAFATGGTLDITSQPATPSLTPGYQLMDLFSNQTVAGNKTFTGVTTFSGNLTLTNLTLGGNESIGGTLAVSGATTLANTTIGSANTLSVNTIRQQAGTAFVLADPLGVSHIFISSSAPYTNTFIQGNGSGSAFLGSAAKAAVSDTTGAITTAGGLTLQTTSQTLPATIANDTLGGLLFTTNAGKGWQIANSTGQLQSFAGVNILLQGATSGGVTLAVPAVAGSNTLTLPAATDTISCNGCTQTLTATTLGGTTPFKRLRANQGTALIAGDFAISAGWGNTASLGSVLGTDAAFSAVVTSAGTGQSAGPTVTLTFHDGTWTNSPICTLAPGPGNNVLATWLIQSVSATALVVQATLISANFTPSAGNTVGLTASCVGR